MASFELKLEDAYWSKGFFNVRVDHERFVTKTEGPFEIFLGDAPKPVIGRVSRSANQNATPRIYGNKALAEFFQSQYKPGDRVKVDITSPTAVRIGAGQGASPFRAAGEK